MPLETASFISDLVASNPSSSDPLANADDHMRLIKAVLKANFPNFTSAALNSTQAQIDAVSAQAARNSFVPAGAVQDFAMATAPTGWLECNGAAVSRTTFSALFTAIGTTWGAGDGSTTFNLPPDRYRVGRNIAGAAVGTLQASQNKSHTHTGSGTTGTVSNDHSHHIDFMSQANDRSLDHLHGISPIYRNNGIGGAGFVVYQSAAVDTSGGSSLYSSSTGAADRSLDHLHRVLGDTGGISANHSHTYSFTTSTGSAVAAKRGPSAQPS